MKPATLVMMISTVSAIGVTAGWVHAIVSVLVAVAAFAAVTYTKEAAPLLARGAPRRARRRERKMADAIIVLAAVAMGRRGGLDVAFEALAWLDEIEDAGARPGRLFRTAIYFAVRLPGQAPDRTDSPTADIRPDESPEPPAGADQDDAEVNQLVLT